MPSTTSKSPARVLSCACRHRLGDEFFARDYYGTVNHNVKAVYQRYLGWFDGNPANLHSLPPVEAGKRYVELAGGADALLGKAREAFARGEFRWVAQLVNHLVFADPSNRDARLLQADALEQLGYQAESGPWRAFYLTAAQELRSGVPAFATGPGVAADIARAMSSDMLFDYLGVRLDGDRAGGTSLELTFRVTDRDELHAVGVRDGALHHVRGRAAQGAQATIALAHDALLALVTGTKPLGDLEAAGAVTLDGDRAALETLLGLLDTFRFWFPIVEP